jgi:predicted RNA-binding protein with PUA-like domain
MFYLLKTEPSDYAISDLQRDRETIWDGVENPQALAYLRRIKSGDACFIYHTGNEKQITGLGIATSDAFAAPDSPKLAAFNIRYEKTFSTPLTLAQIKMDKVFEGFDLVRLPRLSVMPVPEKFLKAILNRLA